MASQPVFTDLEGDRRVVNRRELTLRVDGWAEETRLCFNIRNLSQTGFSLEAKSNFPQGQIVEIELPQGGSEKAALIWAKNGLIGFKFLKPLTKGLISAAALRSEFSAQQSTSNFHTQGPSHPLYEVTSDASQSEKLPRHIRLLIVLASAIVPWAVIIGGLIVAY